MCVKAEPSEIKARFSNCYGLIIGVHDSFFVFYLQFFHVVRSDFIGCHVFGGDGFGHIGVGVVSDVVVFELTAARSGGLLRIDGGGGRWRVGNQRSVGRSCRIVQISAGR